MDLTAILLSAVVVLFVLSGPRGKNRYYPLGYGLFIAALCVYYGFTNGDWTFYSLAAAAFARGYYLFYRWR